MKSASLHKIIYKVCLWTLCALCITSCRQESVIGEGDASVTIRLKSPGVTLTTRGVSDDPKNENGTWTTEDLLVDGSRLYRVTLLVVDSNGYLAGMKDWNDIQTTLPTEVSTEIRDLKLNSTYRIIAVANYSAYGDWAGLPDFPDLANLTVGEDVSTTIATLDSYNLTDANSDRVAARRPQPLSMVRQFSTFSGESMVVEGELLRTYARIRIEIANQNKDLPLLVNGLNFGFGQNTESLLPVGDEYIQNADGSLVETSEDAITPFAPLSVPSLGDENGNSRLVFDGYVYECKNTNGLNYSLDLEYFLSSLSYEVYVKGNGENSPVSSGLGWYMIGYGDGYYLSVDENNQLVAIRISDAEFETTNAFWKIVNNGSAYVVQSVDKGLYLEITNAEVRLSESETQLQISERKLYNYFDFYWYGYNHYLQHYFCVENNVDFKVYISWQNPGTDFTFYPISSENRTETNVTERNITIPLEALVDEVSSPTNIIRRNDFFNVAVSVFYDKVSGELDYKVENWTTVGGDIAFQ